MDTFALGADTAGSISGVVGVALLGALLLVILGNTPPGKRVAKSIVDGRAARAKERKTLKDASNRGKTAARAKHAKETAQDAEAAKLAAGPQPSKWRRGFNGFKAGVAAIGKGADAISAKTNPRLAAALMGSANKAAKAKPGGGRIRRALAGRLLGSVYPGDGDAGNSTPDPPAAGTPKPAATAPATPTPPATPASPAPTTPATPAAAGPTSNVTPLFPNAPAGGSMLVDQIEKLARLFADLGNVNLENMSDRQMIEFQEALAAFGYTRAETYKRLTERFIGEWNLDHRVTGFWADAAKSAGDEAGDMHNGAKKYTELYEAPRKAANQDVAPIRHRTNPEATKTFWAQTG